MAVLTLHKPGKLIAALMLAALLFHAPIARAQDSSAPLQLYEQKIKAGLLYNFLKYTSWPADVISRSNGALRVCLLGADPFDGYLYPLDGKTAQQYVIMITRVSSASDTGGCSLVYIHRSEEAHLPEILETLHGQHVLTVSDIGGFAALGGMVEFATEDQRINLVINKRAVDSAGLGIQNRLLKLAKLVTTRNG